MITARYFSSSPSDSTSRWTPCPPEYCEMAASGPPWLVSSFRFRARLGFSIPSFLSGQRGITPAFGYGAPHLSAGGTPTLLSNALLSTHYGAVRLLQSVHVRRSALRLLGPASNLTQSGRSRGLPVLVHVVSQRARFSDYAGPAGRSRLTQPAVLPSSSTSESQHPDQAFFEAQ